ncbi:hypothetical protein [Marivirga tractuosa]|uniref:Uncharacterized protein n=1 Tax=Marivirga tractuosa (strain ATCC 23168 / DSM 4126 / NBRC 15989 / NCIMB 1408 / VKM B-1430 / H-43) TaxID=643867 RepID=E4TLI1_MARTH|nr:hypothetical protein [Marivirga tractuosa]ADR21302.1 hypothetical protein Ftrac_1311 [Marivirga tractuosa DSM 4126]
MTLKNAINFFESLEAETNRKSEKKVYQEFVQIITSLQKKDLPESDIQSIETELDNFNLKSNSVNRKNIIKKRLMILKNI